MSGEYYFSLSDLNNKAFLDFCTFFSYRSTGFTGLYSPFADAIAAHKAEKGPHHGGAAKWGKHLRQGGLGKGAFGAGCARLYRLLPG